MQGLILQGTSLTLLPPFRLLCHSNSYSTSHFPLIYRSSFCSFTAHYGCQFSLQKLPGYPSKFLTYHMFPGISREILPGFLAQSYGSRLIREARPEHWQHTAYTASPDIIDHTLLVTLCNAQVDVIKAATYRAFTSDLSSQEMGSSSSAVTAASYSNDIKGISTIVVTERVGRARHFLVRLIYGVQFLGKNSPASLGVDL